MTAALLPPAEIAIRHFRERFLNRTDAVAILAPWRKPLPVAAGENLDALLATHLLAAAAPEAVYQYTTRKGTTATKGRHRVGTYCPGPDNLTRWVCVDLDGAGHAEALADPRATALVTMHAFEAAGLPAHLERSGSGKGWHVWAFFDPPIEAGKAQALGRALVPRDAPLADGGRFADPLAGRGIEVFPKQARVRKKGFGNMVWLPWWRGAKDGGNLFCRVGPSGDLEPYVPEEFRAASPGDVERVLSEHPSEEPRGRAPGPGPPAGAPSGPGASSTGASNPQWSEWRKRALAALPLEAVYGPWLTGNTSGPGRLQCREPWAPNGDRDPSASVADGTGEAERGAFHSFLSGKNFSVFDFLIARGEAKDFREAAATVAERSGVPLPAPPAASAGGGLRTVRPEIRVNNRQLRSVLEDAWRAVHSANRSAWPSLFARLGTLVRLTFAEGVPRIDVVTEDALCGHLAQIADWVKVTEDAVLDTHPPRDAVRVMLASPDLSLPPLEAVVTAPVFAPDGSLVSAPGYHEGARLWYDPPADLAVPEVPEQPSEEDVVAARSLLFGELLGDFPFVSPAASAHMVGAMVLPFVRRLILGPTPIHLFEAPTEGSGKGLLVTLIALLVTGAPAAGGSLPEDEDEVRKKVGAELSSGRPLLVLDNADNKRVLDSSALASATTMWPTWTDRLLGHNRMFSVPNSVLWVLTANNPRISRELARRCVSIRIDPRMDRPWLRSGFRHPDLLDWALAHRGELVRALLVLVRNWIARGSPPAAKRLGTFERWSDTVGGILGAAGIEGFLENLDTLYATADAEGTMWREFLGAWWDTHGALPVRVAELFRLCTTGDLMAPVLGDKSERSQTTRLGNALQNARDRVFGGCRIEAAGRDAHSKGKLYRLVRDVGSGAPAESSDAMEPTVQGAGAVPSLLTDFGD